MFSFCFFCSVWSTGSSPASSGGWTGCRHPSLDWYVLCSFSLFRFSVILFQICPDTYPWKLVLAYITDVCHLLQLLFHASLCSRECVLKCEEKQRRLIGLVTGSRQSVCLSDSSLLISIHAELSASVCVCNVWSKLCKTETLCSGVITGVLFLKNPVINQCCSGVGGWVAWLCLTIWASALLKIYDLGKAANELLASWGLKAYLQPIPHKALPCGSNWVQLSWRNYRDL